MTETVRPTDTAGDLLGRLAVAGAGLLVATLDGIENGSLVAKPQPAEGVSLAPKLTVDDARVDWSRPAFVVDRLVRGCTPNPGAWTTFRGERVKVEPVTPADDPTDGPRGDLGGDQAGRPRRDGVRERPARRRPGPRQEADARGGLGAGPADRTR